MGHMVNISWSLYKTAKQYAKVIVLFFFTATGNKKGSSCPASQKTLKVFLRFQLGIFFFDMYQQVGETKRRRKTVMAFEGLLG